MSISQIHSRTSIQTVGSFIKPPRYARVVFLRLIATRPLLRPELLRQLSALQDCSSRLQLFARYREAKGLRIGLQPNRQIIQPNQKTDVNYIPKNSFSCFIKSLPSFKLVFSSKITYVSSLVIARIFSVLIMHFFSKKIKHSGKP